MEVEHATKPLATLHLTITAVLRKNSDLRSFRHDDAVLNSAPLGIARKSVADGRLTKIAKRSILILERCCR